MRLQHAFGFPVLFTFLLVLQGSDHVVQAEFQAGAARVEITPEQFPVSVNGGMLSRSLSKVKSRLHARAIFLAQGKERIGIVVVDSCMLPRPLLDEVKSIAAERMNVKSDHLLISATHTHSAPASMSCLGTNFDPNYVPFLREKLIEALLKAEANLEPAVVGWGLQNAQDFTALRRWIRRPDKIALDPFGNPTVRANMHSGRNWDDVTGESGPEDPDLSMISFRSKKGRPIALLANFSMHYFSDRDISADYFGLFCESLEQKIPADENSPSASKETESETPPFVAILSHGCSGDIWRRDYTIASDKRNDKIGMEEYTAGLVRIAEKAYQQIVYQSHPILKMQETRFRLNYRVPDKQRLEWAERIVEEMGDRLPKNQQEVYAVEQTILHKRQSTEVVVQALRLGDICIATTPNETYALTGLKIKLQSPFPQTMVIELANGGDGYIPPPEQHILGGYNTWAARSAGLEVLAEPKIAEAAIHLLEQVTAKLRRNYNQQLGTVSAAILKAKPVAYWRLDEFSGPTAKDATAANHDASYEDGVVFFLEGPLSGKHNRKNEVNRAAHFAGGRLRSRLSSVKTTYSVSLWLWNGLPHNSREVNGWFFSRERDFGRTAFGDHVGVTGTKHEPGKLMFLKGNELDSENSVMVGKTSIPRWIWSHIVFVRDDDQVSLYLNGNREFQVKSDHNFPPVFDQFFLGGRADRTNSFEGRLDEIAIFDRALSEKEIRTFSGRKIQK